MSDYVFVRINFDAKIYSIVKPERVVGCYTWKSTLNFITYPITMEMSFVVPVSQIYVVNWYWHIGVVERVCLKHDSGFCILLNDCVVVSLIAITIDFSKRCFFLFRNKILRLCINISIPDDMGMHVVQWDKHIIYTYTFNILLMIHWIEIQPGIKLVFNAMNRLYFCSTGTAYDWFLRTGCHNTNIAYISMFCVTKCWL